MNTSCAGKNQSSCDGPAIYQADVYPMTERSNYFPYCLKHARHYHGDRYSVVLELAVRVVGDDDSTKVEEV